MPIVISKDNGFLDLLRSNLKQHYMDHKRKVTDVIHVSDILQGNCLRKAYYSRTVEDYEFTDEDIDNFVRGEASEHVLVDLADIGVGQLELDFEKGLVMARPDLYSDHEGGLIVEFKDTKTFERLTPDHYKFKTYLRQLLYYLVIGGKEHGVLNIRYASNRKLQWLTRDDQGDYYYAPLIYQEDGEMREENKLPELESWSVFLGKDDFVRELLKNEIIDRATKLRMELDHNSKTPYSIHSTITLPKVAEKWKCVRCPFLKICDPDSVEQVDSLKDGILDNFVELKSTIMTHDDFCRNSNDFEYTRGENQN
jgi:hypothetical protein